MFNIFKKINNTKKDYWENQWELLTNEKRIEIANMVLKDEKTTIMGCCGDIENSRLIECVGVDIYDNGEYYKFLTSDSFYKTVSFSKKQIIDRWIYLNKYGNKNYSNME